MAISGSLFTGDVVSGGGTQTYTASVPVHATDIFVINTGASDTTFTLTLTPNGGSGIQIYKAVPLKASGTRVLSPMHLSYGDALTITSAGSVFLTVLGESFG